MSDHPSNQGASTNRQFNQMPPNQNPPANLQYYFPPNQHPSQSSSSNYHHHAYQPYYDRTVVPPPPPVPMTNNLTRMPQVGYGNNILLTQSIQQQVTVDRWVPRQSLVPPVRVQIPPPPPPVQTISVVETPPQSHSFQSAPSQPLQLPNSPAEENLGAVVPVTASTSNNFEETQENEQETERILLEALNANKAYHYKALDKLSDFTENALKKELENRRKLNQSNNKLSAEKDALSAQLLEKEQELADIRFENDEIKKKCENDVRQAKSEEAVWRDNFVHLNAMHVATKSESEEKDRNIYALEAKARENEDTISDLNVKVLNFEMSERKMKKELEEKGKIVESLGQEKAQGEIKINEYKDKVHQLESSEGKLNEDLENKNKIIKKWERKYNRKCDELAGVQSDFKMMQTTNRDLEKRVNDLVAKDKANEICVENLKTSFKTRVEELEGTISEKIKEIGEITQVLGIERDLNKNAMETRDKELEGYKEKVNVLENCNKTTTEQLNKLQTEHDDLLKEAEKQRETTVEILRKNSTIIQSLNDNLRSLTIENQDLERLKFELFLKTTRITELEGDLNSSKKVNEDLRIIFKNGYSVIFPENLPNQNEQLQLCSSPSFEQESLSGSSSSQTAAVDEDKKFTSDSRCNEVANLESQENSPEATQIKRKYVETDSNAAKKQCGNDNDTKNHNEPQTKVIINLPEVSQIRFHKKSNTEGDEEMGEISGTSSSSGSSSDTN